jgi:hypothetical protein
MALRDNRGALGRLYESKTVRAMFECIDWDQGSGISYDVSHERET